MKRALAVIAALAGCHDKPADPAPTAIRDAAPPPDANLEVCKLTIANTVAKLAPTQRLKALLDACRPCGSWKPLLEWNKSEDLGGPSRRDIETAMTACNAYCNGNAKQRFLGVLDEARGQSARGPWRALGEACKAAVSAETDTRYMGAAYFALDRIGRAVGDAALLAQIPIPLPALSLTGVGVSLPVSPAVAAEAGPAALTVLASELQLGALPIATLTPDGVHVAGDYPGARIELADLAGKLAALGTVAVVAPRELPATRIVEVIAASGGHAMQLAVASSVPGSWSLPGALPIALGAKPAAGVRITLDKEAGDAVRAAKVAPGLTTAPVTIVVAPGATVAGLASLLGALGFLEVRAVALVKSAKP